MGVGSAADTQVRVKSCGGFAVSDLSSSVMNITPFGRLRGRDSTKKVASASAFISILLSIR